MTVTDVGAIPLGYYTSGTGGAFAPADTFSGLVFDPSNNIEFTVVGTGATPEPKTWLLMGAAFTLLLLFLKAKICLSE